MSLDLYVVLNRKDLPSAETWASTLRSEGFSVNLDTSPSPATSAGYWPCPGSASGFEYSLGPLDQAEIKNLGVSSRRRQRLRHYDSIAVLSCRTETDLAVAQSAAAVLASISDGLLIEGESAAVMTPDQALAWARGSYEPPLEKGRPAFLPKPRTSGATWARLGLLALLVSYWLYRWATGH